MKFFLNTRLFNLHTINSQLLSTKVIFKSLHIDSVIITFKITTNNIKHMHNFTPRPLPLPISNPRSDHILLPFYVQGGNGS